MRLRRHTGCYPTAPWVLRACWRIPMEPLNLTIWLPGMFVLGLAVMGLMFAFVVACEKV